MSSSTQTFVASMEAFLYRGVSPLFQDLVAITADGLPTEGAPEQVVNRMQALSAIAERYSKAIKHHTNMSITITMMQGLGYQAMVMPPVLDVNHVMRFEKFASMFVGTKVEYTGIEKFLNKAAVANDRGGVEGIYADVVCPMYVAVDLFDGKFSAEEIAAIVLHEIGHVYSYFATIGRTVFSSLLITETMKQLRMTIGLDKRKQLIDNTTQTLHLDTVDAEELAHADERVAEAVLIRSAILRLESDTGTSNDVFNGEVEFAADSYATRSGAAAPLMSAYVKINRVYGEISTKTTREVVMSRALMGAAMIITAMVASPVLSTVVMIISGLTLIGGQFDLTERNNPIERIEQVHRDLVNLLKNRNLPKEQQKQVLRDIEFISALRSDLTERLSLVSMIWYTLSPTRRKIYKQQQFQRDIVRLVNNDLFVSAAQLAALKKP